MKWERQMRERYANDWPRFADEVLKVRLDYAQQDILDSVQRNRRTIVRSGNARGKDYVAAVAGLCFLYLNVPSKVIETAPTGRQVSAIMMSESRTIWQNAQQHGMELGGRFLNDGIRMDSAPD